MFEIQRLMLTRPFLILATAVLAAAIILPLICGLSNLASLPYFHLLKREYNDISPIWTFQQLKPVNMIIENTVHYELNGTLADHQWSSIIPENGGIVHLGPEYTPFMPSMFHQLRCLDILRQAFVEANPSSRLQQTSRHCLNYLRQMLLCRSDLKLEPVVDPYGAHAVDFYGPSTCLDWREVYDEVEKNERRYGGREKRKL